MNNTVKFNYEKRGIFILSRKILILLLLLIIILITSCSKRTDEDSKKDQLNELENETNDKTPNEDEFNSNKTIQDVFGSWTTDDGNSTIVLALIHSSGVNLFRLDNLSEEQPLAQGNFQFISNGEEYYIELDDGIISELEIVEENNELILKNDGLNLKFYLLEKYDYKIENTSNSNNSDNSDKNKSNSVINNDELDVDEFFKYVMDNDLYMVKSYINRGIDINIQDNDGVSALMIAAINDDYSLAKLLIEKGANVNVTTNSGASPLHFAAQEGSSFVAELLITNGANIDIQEYEKGNTPIITAIAESNLNIIQLLYYYDADLLMKNKLNMSAIDIAMKLGDKDVNSFLGIDQILNPTFKTYDELKSDEENRIYIFGSDASELDSMYEQIIGDWEGNNELGENISFEFYDDRTFKLIDSNNKSVSGYFYINNYNLNESSGELKTIYQMWVGTETQMSKSVNKIDFKDKDTLVLTDLLGYKKIFTK